MHGDFGMRWHQADYIATPRVVVRWMVRSDMGGVVDIDAACDRPMGLAAVERFVKKRDAIGFAALEDGDVVGFMLLALRRDETRVRRLCVAPARRRRGVGSALVAKAVSKLAGGRDAVAIPVPETCLAMQLFLKSRGFGVGEILRGFHDDPPEDSYVFYGPVPPPRSEFLVISPTGDSAEACRGR